MRKVYRTSFPNEFNKGKDFDNLELLYEATKKDFKKFCKNYDIIPDIIEVGLAVSILEVLMTQSKDDLYLLEVKIIFIY